MTPFEAPADDRLVYSQDAAIADHNRGDDSWLHHRLVFHHINKCAGTTLLYFLGNFYPKQDHVMLEQLNLSETFADHNILARARFIHDPFGHADWKQYLTSVQTLVFLRDPIDRLVSDWMMVAAWTDDLVAGNPENEAIREVARQGLLPYLVSPLPGISLFRWNSMTRHMLMGDAELSPRWAALEAQYNPVLAARALDSAVSNLGTIDFIGLVEDFDASVARFCLTYGIDPTLEIQSHNSRGGRHYRDTLTAEELATAEAATTLDRALYQAGLDRYRAQVARSAATHGADSVAKAVLRAEKKLSEPPEWVVCAMGEALNGCGWHGSENNPPKLSRWIGPHPTAMIRIRVQKAGRMMIRIACTSFRDPAQLDALRLTADGAPVPLTRWVHLEQVHFFEGQIDADQLKPDDLLRLAFDCGFVCETGNPDDPRLLGLEFTEIEVGPVGRFRLGRPGTGTAG